MKKTIYLLIAFILISLNSIANTSGDYVELKIPNEYKSLVKYDKYRIAMYTVVTKNFNTKKIKGKITMISDSYGKIIKIIVPKNFPMEFSYENYIKEKVSSQGIPCSWCTHWWCWLICDDDASGPKEIEQK